jgi:hypothetical protein
MTDLFEQYETLPKKVKDIIDVFNLNTDVTENSYELCEDLINALEEVGYTCEYDLEGVPFNLSVLNSFSGEKTMKIGDKVKYKTRKNSIEPLYGTILGFKMDKIKVSKYKFSDYSGFRTETYIDKEDII